MPKRTSRRHLLRNTNNQAEYQALMGLLSDYLAHRQRGPLIVHGDSELVMNQVNGDYMVHDKALAQLCAGVSNLAAQTSLVVCASDGFRAERMPWQIGWQVA
jgi:ribonuclease HI